MPAGAPPSCPAPICRLLTYAVLAVLLGGSIYGVARVGRGNSGGMAAAGIDEFALSDALLDNARVGTLLGAAAAAKVAAGRGSSMEGSGSRQQQQRHGAAHHHHVHEDVHDRRAALEQQHHQQQQEQHVLAAAAGGGAVVQEVTQEQLEQQHLAQLQHLEQQHALAAQQALEEQQQQQQQHVGGAEHGHDPALEEHVAAHIAAQQALPRREGPSLYSANLSGERVHSRGGEGRGDGLHRACARTVWVWAGRPAGQ